MKSLAYAALVTITLPFLAMALFIIFASATWHKVFGSDIES